MPVEDKKETLRPQKALFYWPLAIALGLSGLLALGLLPWRFWLSSVLDKPLAAEKKS